MKKYLDVSYAYATLRLLDLPFNLPKQFCEEPLDAAKRRLISRLEGNAAIFWIL